MPPFGIEFIASQVLDWELGQTKSCGRGLGTQRARLEKNTVAKKQNVLRYGKDFKPWKRVFKEGPV